MSDMYIARQPIFDKDMKIFGYKLFYHDDFTFASQIDENDREVASLVDNMLLVEFDSLTDAALGFVKFTDNLIIGQAPLLFPNKKTIVEIQDDARLDENFLEELSNLKDLGYIVAIDDFDTDNPDKYSDILKYVDIAKVNYTSKEEDKYKKLINEKGGRLVFLAKNVETRDGYKKAQNIGFKLFQGTFYSKPVKVKSKSIGVFSENLVFILNELNKSEPDFNDITTAFERDIELSYKLLRMVNSAYYGVKYHTDSLRLALLQIGRNELIRWINILLLRGIKSPQNAELIKTSIVRGKMLGMLSIVTKKRAQESNYFISGLFSSIDVLLNDSMENIVSRLPLGDVVCKTLLNEPTDIRYALNAVIEYEKGNWSEIDVFLKKNNINQEEFISLYIDAIKWQKTL